MKKKVFKVFIAIDTTDLKKAKKIIAQSQTNKIKVGYKFGSIFMNSKKGRQFVSRLNNKIVFIDQKLHDTVQTITNLDSAEKEFLGHIYFAEPTELDLEKVVEFNETFGVPVSKEPQLDVFDKNPKLTKLRFARQRAVSTTTRRWHVLR